MNSFIKIFPVFVFCFLALPVIAHGDDVKTGIINVNLKEINPENSPNTKNISISKVEIETDPLKTAFYNFTQGNNKEALAGLKEYYGQIDPDDDYARMQLALKLVSMAYLNFAGEVLGEIKEKEIWGKMSDEFYKLYLPGNFVPESIENVQSMAYYILHYEDRPEAVLEITQNAGNFDYLRYLRAKAYKKIKKYDLAEKEINIAIKINPENLNYKLDLVNILAAKNEIRSAQMELGNLKRQAEKENITNREFLRNFKIYEYWLKTLEFGTDPVAGKYYEAYYHTVKEELEAALEILNKLAYKSKEAYVYELLGKIYYELGYYEPSRKAFKQGLNIDGNRVDSLTGLGNIYFITGQNDLAGKYYRQALDKFPQNVEALMAMARFESYLNNAENAYEYFKKILKIDKNNTDVIYNIGINLANRKKINEAEKMFKKALAADPMWSLIWLDLAKIELARQNYPTAVKYLKYINSIDENNPYYYYYMSVIFDKNNKKEESELFLKKAFELAPGLLREIKE